MRKPSVAKYAADERNAAAEGAGSPRRAVAGALTEGFERTWAMIDGCLRRWRAEDLEVEFSRTRGNGEVQTFTRVWVVWHLIEHDLHHGGEISQILGTNELLHPSLTSPGW